MNEKKIKKRIKERTKERIKELETKLFSLGVAGLAYTRQWQEVSKELDKLKKKEVKDK